jgi:hypothetical protein
VPLVTAALRGPGYDVYPLSLTGLGERAHLARPDTDLDFHVTDVVNLLVYEGLLYSSGTATPVRW